VTNSVKLPGIEITDELELVALARIELRYVSQFALLTPPLTILTVQL